MSEKDIPDLAFRIDPAYEFDTGLRIAEFESDNVLVGQLPRGNKRDAVFLGKLAEHQAGRKKVWLDTDGAHAIYVMGKRRSGKTYSLGVLAEGLAAQSWIKQGEQRHPVLLLDTMNVFSTMHHTVEHTYGEDSDQVRDLEKWRLDSEEFNVVLFFPSGTPRPAEGNSKEIAIRPADLSAEEWAALFEVDTYSDPTGQLIAELYEKVALEGYQDRSGTTVQANVDYSIDDIVQCLDQCPDIQRYGANTIEAVRRRMKAVNRLPIFSKRGLQVDNIFRAGQVSILLLRDLEQNLRSLLVGILVKKIFERRSIADRYERLAAIKYAGYERYKESNPSTAVKCEDEYRKYIEQAKAGIPRGWVIIDEAHNYMPARGITPSSAPLRRYVNEGRNLGLSIVVATQSPSALDPSIRRNADVLVIHSMSMRDDIATAEGMVNTIVPDEFVLGRSKVTSRSFEHLVRSLPLGFAVISDDRANRILVTRIRPRLTIHGGVEY